MTGRERPRTPPSRLPFLPSLRLYPAEPQQEGMGSIPLLIEAVGAASRSVGRVLDQRLGDEALTPLLDLAEQISMQGMRWGASTKSRPAPARSQ